MRGGGFLLPILSSHRDRRLSTRDTDRYRPTRLLSQSRGSVSYTHLDVYKRQVAHRRLFGGGNGQTIAKAVGIQPGVRPVVLDATAGLGRDAFVLARLGCAMTLIERHPLIAALLEDGLWRALANPVVGPTAAQMHLICANAIDVLRAWDGVPPQVIYLDPMFPHRDKSALVKKEMRLFRPLTGDDDLSLIHI